MWWMRASRIPAFCEWEIMFRQLSVTREDDRPVVARRGGAPAPAGTLVDEI